MAWGRGDQGQCPSAYDASHLDLAMRLDAMLATHDAAPRRMSEAAGVTVHAA